MLSKVYVLDGAVMNKSKQTLHRSEVRVTKYSKKQLKYSIWNSSADLPDPAEVVAASAARTLPSTRAGGQDDVS